MTIPFIQSIVALLVGIVLIVVLTTKYMCGIIQNGTRFFAGCDHNGSHDGIAYVARSWSRLYDGQGLHGFSYIKINYVTSSFSA